MCAKHDEKPPEGAKMFTGLLLDEPTARSIGVTSANTVLGPVDARRLGVTLVCESLMYVLPGAQYAYDIKIDRAEVFDLLAAKLMEFKAAGGGRRHHRRCYRHVPGARPAPVRGALA